MIMTEVYKRAKGHLCMTTNQQGTEGRVEADLGGRQGLRPSPGGRHRG